jgi:WD40 repeat protein
VKNIEYDKKSDKIFSVAFQDGVREWPLKDLKGSTCEMTENLVFKLEDPVRMRIAPDGSRMFVSMRINECLVINDFDGSSVMGVRNEVEQLVSKSKMDPSSCKRVNRPTLLVMSGLRSSKNSYRSVMSASFHPISEMIALRHVDMRSGHLQHELSTLYDLKMSESTTQPYLNIRDGLGRYLKYSDEYSPDTALDYIKECSFSPDGRVLASPHADNSPPAYGVRLLAMDTKCTPVEMYYDDRFFSPEKNAGCCDFEVVSSLFGHSDPVLCCAFAHHEMILGTGSMEGHILFHKPQL